MRVTLQGLKQQQQQQQQLVSGVGSGLSSNTASGLSAVSGKGSSHHLYDALPARRADLDDLLGVFPTKARIFGPLGYFSKYRPRYLAAALALEPFHLRLVARTLAFGGGRSKKKKKKTDDGSDSDSDSDSGGEGDRSSSAPRALASVRRHHGDAAAASTMLLGAEKGSARTAIVAFPPRVVAGFLPHLPAEVRSSLIVKFGRDARLRVAEWESALKIAAWMSGASSERAGVVLADYIAMMSCE